MTPYVTKCLPKEDIFLFSRIERAVQRLPDIDLGEDEDGRKILLSCHILARAVARVFKVRTEDGFLVGGRCRSEHAWVVTKTGNIIDVYPVAVLGGPLLIDNRESVSPMQFLYSISPGMQEKYRDFFSRESFQRSVRTITKALRSAAKKD